MGVEVEPDRDRQPRRHRAHAAEQLALAVVRVLGDHRAVEREERGVAAAAHRADDGLGHLLVGGLLDVAGRVRAAPRPAPTISAPAFCATPRNPPSCVLVSRNSSIAAAPASGRNDASGVGTGENVLVSCIIIATTIFRRAMWSVLSPRVPVAAAPQSYTRAARLDRVAPAAHYRRRRASSRPHPHRGAAERPSAILETTTAERLATGFGFTEGEHRRDKGPPALGSPARSRADRNAATAGSCCSAPGTDWSSA